MDHRRSMLLVLLITLFHVTRSNEEHLLSRHVPLILWSPTSVFKAQNRYVAASLDDHGVVSVLKDLMRSSPEKEFGALGPFSDNDSEMFCLFLFPKLHTNELPLFRRVQTAKASVEEFVQHATSSVVAPYTTRADSIKKMLDDDDTVVLSINDVDEFLESDEAKALSSNNKKDLLIVEIPEDMSFVKADSLIKTTVALITKSTEERVDFGLTSDHAAEYNREGTEALRQSRRLDQAAQLQCEVGYILGGSIEKPFCFSRYVHMTPEILSGILIGFFFILLLYVGIGAMHSLQTPTRFPAHGPPKGKEF